jgi:type IV secretion system protein VirB4
MASLSNYKPALENDVTSFLPYSSQVDENTVKTVGGDYFQVIKLEGKAHETADPENVVQWKRQLVGLLKSVASPQVALWTNIIRRKTEVYPEGEYEPGFSEKLNTKYQKYLLNGATMMVNELYLTIIYRPQTVTKRFSCLRKMESQETLLQEQKESIEKLRKIVKIIFSGISTYGPKLLGTYQKDGILHSEVVEFLSSLANGNEWVPRALPHQPLNESLAYNRIYFGADAFEVRGVAKQKYGVILAIGEYPEKTEPGLLNALLSAPFEAVISQSFSFISRPVSIEMLQRQQRIMRNAGDLAESQIQSIDDALDDLSSGRLVFGVHHLAVTIYGSNAKELNNNLSDAHAEITNYSITVAREDFGIEAAYWSQLPGNFKYRTRPQPVSSKNFAGFCSFHNYPTGRSSGNQWGPAVTMFRTSSGAPYYFNFHEGINSTPKIEPITGKREKQKALGNTGIIGPSGSGKTVLQGFLLSQSRKYKPTQIVFDKDLGLEIYVRAEGGVYFPLKTGKRTGFNPFQFDNTAANRLFLESLLKKCAGGSLSAKDEQELSEGIRGVMALPLHLRKISAMLQFLDPTLDDGLYNRLLRWCGDNSLGWVFDNDTDELDFSTNKMFGFDVSEFLDDGEIRTPVVMYIFHALEASNIFDGRRVQILMDEFWKLLLDDYFLDFANNKLKVIRKQNGVLIMGTQSARDVLDSRVAHTIIEQCATMIFLPNAKANRVDYVDGFHLTEREFDLIKNELTPESRMFLVKQGNNSVVAELNLSGFSDELAVISGTSDNVGLLHEIMSEVGEEPVNWYQKFQQER